MDNKEQSETPLHLKLSIATSLNTRMGDKIEKLEADIEHKDEYINQLQEEVKNIGNLYSKIQIRCNELENENNELETKIEEEEDHNKELVELITEMMDMIKEWHSEDITRARNNQDSRETTMRRYMRDMGNIIV